MRLEEVARKVLLEGKDVYDPEHAKTPYHETLIKNGYHYGSSYHHSDNTAHHYHHNRDAHMVRVVKYHESGEHTVKVSKYHTNPHPSEIEKVL